MATGEGMSFVAAQLVQAAEAALNPASTQQQRAEAYQVFCLQSDLNNRYLKLEMLCK